MRYTIGNARFFFYCFPAHGRLRETFPGMQAFYAICDKYSVLRDKMKGPHCVYYKGSFLQSYTQPKQKQKLLSNILFDLAIYLRNTNCIKRSDASCQKSIW